VRVVEEVSGAAVEFTITTDMPANTQLLSPRNYMNTGATAAAVAYDCAGLYSKPIIEGTIMTMTERTTFCRRSARPSAKTA
jgi:hypothetical protein